MTTRGEWATELLAALGNSSPTPQTVNFVATWTLGENTYAKYNPLATTQPMSGATDFNFAHVKNYSDDQTGIDATVKTLQNGYYPHILHGLQNNDPEEAANATELGIWGTGVGFVSLWRLGDHRNEALHSHEGQGGGGTWGTEHNEYPGVPRVGPPDAGNSNPGGSAVGAPQLPQDQLSGGPHLDTAEIARNVEFIALGLLLISVALVLVVRSYVPTKQIVKTIAEVA